MKPPWPATATRWAPPVHLRPFALRHGACYRAVASQAATTDDGTPPKVDSSNLYNHFITRGKEEIQYPSADRECHVAATWLPKRGLAGFGVDGLRHLL